MNENSSTLEKSRLIGFSLIPYGRWRPRSKNELKEAVDAWCVDKESTRHQYGDINTWDTTGITDMSSLFEGKKNFDDDIGGWNVSNVTNLRNMFQDAHAFNQDLSNWDVSNVTNMRGIFWDAHAFNQDLSNWDVSNVENRFCMFCDEQ